MDASTVNASLASLLLLSSLMGFRHGFDADHLATIDALTRLSKSRRRYLFGALFSLGHGCTVLAVAVAVCWLGSRWVVPAWFEWSGVLISASLLLILGTMNLFSLIHTPARHPVALHGLRSRALAGLVSRLGQGGWPAPVFIGALFALSFDTLSQAVLFSTVSGSPVQSSFQPLVAAVLLAGSFTLGMLISDGLNGWLIAGMLSRSDRLANIASRVMCLAVVTLSYFVAFISLARLSGSSGGLWLEQVFEGSAWLMPVIALAWLLSLYGLGQYLGRARREARASVELGT